MRAVALMARVTLREAARRKVVWMALLASAVMFLIFAVSLHLQVLEFQSRAM